MCLKIIILTIFILFCNLNSDIFGGNLDLSQALPTDEKVLIGKLDNGMTYYIRHNATPANEAVFKLVVGGGSVVELDDQLGLSHFAEHMAFWGTENFPDNTVREYMRSINATWGASAYYDWTQYTLTLMDINETGLDNLLLLLSDFSARLTFDHHAIDIEREIILQEIRGSMSGANSRWIHQRVNTVWTDSKYAVRNVIGTPEVIANFDYQSVKDYYHDWYRPDLQAVIAVGNFDVEEIKDLIYKHFDNIPRRENPKPRPDFTVPDNAETIFSMTIDEEITHNLFSINYKQPARRTDTFADFREELIERLLLSMLNSRFTKISRELNPPFVSAWASLFTSIKPIREFVFSVSVEDDYMEGFKGIITEIERAKQHGFHGSELTQAKDELLASYRRRYQERNNSPSDEMTWIYQNHFIFGNIMASIEFIHENIDKFLESISMTDVQNSLVNMATDHNRIVTIMGTQNMKEKLPSEGDIITLFSNIQKSSLEKFPETVIDTTLIKKLPKRVKVKKPKYDSTLGKYTWRLKNGATIHLKTTDYKNDEILFSAVRTGGLSQADDNIFNSARLSPNIISYSGLGNLDANQLERFLSSKQINLHSSFTNNNERFSGSSSVADLETLFQLLWLNFNSPIYDQTAFEIWKQKELISLRNKGLNPVSSFNDAVNNMTYDDHLRMHPYTVDDVLSINHKVAFDFYRSRFSSANSFHFTFVGNINKDDLHKFIEVYIATLPGSKVNTNIVDRGIRFNQTSGRREVNQGVDDRSLVSIVFTNDFDFSFSERQKFSAANFVFGYLLIENIRERIGGLYNIFSTPIYHKEPFRQLAVTVHFGCAPDQVDMFINEVVAQVRNLQTGDFDDKFLETYKDAIQRSEKNKTNNAWLRDIEDSILIVDSSDIIKRIDISENMKREDIIKMANKYFDLDKMLVVVLFPE